MKSRRNQLSQRTCPELRKVTSTVTEESAESLLTVREKVPYEGLVRAFEQHVRNLVNYIGNRTILQRFHLVDCGGLFADYRTPGLRPDYYLRLGETGILLEVERGKTTINNMDLLDFWKCHLCRHAHYLFLLVPRELRQNDDPGGRPTRPFAAVEKRLSSFFQQGNETNVRAVCIFGY